MKRIVIVAGPNGAGKTTFAKEYLPREADCPNFINADLIAAGLSPFNPAAAAVQAGRLMIREMRRYLRHGESFAFETDILVFPNLPSVENRFFMWFLMQPEVVEYA